MKRLTFLIVGIFANSVFSPFSTFHINTSHLFLFILRFAFFSESIQVTTLHLSSTNTCTMKQLPKYFPCHYTFPLHNFSCICYEMNVSALFLYYTLTQISLLGSQICLFSDNQTCLVSPSLHMHYSLQLENQHISPLFLQFQTYLLPNLRLNHPTSLIYSACITVFLCWNVFCKYSFLHAYDV